MAIKQWFSSIYTAYAESLHTLTTLGGALLTMGVSIRKYLIIARGTARTQETYSIVEDTVHALDAEGDRRTTQTGVLTFLALSGGGICVVALGTLGRALPIEDEVAIYTAGADLCWCAGVAWTHTLHALIVVLVGDGGTWCQAFVFPVVVHHTPFTWAGLSTFGTILRISWTLCAGVLTLLAGVRGGDGNGARRTLPLTANAMQVVTLFTTLTHTHTPAS